MSLVSKNWKTNYIYIQKKIYQICHKKTANILAMFATPLFIFSSSYIFSEGNSFVGYFYWLIKN